MIVAVTGANGFIGRNLVRELGSAGSDVREITRRDLELGGIRERLSGANVVVHAAGATRAATVAALRESNVALTARILDAARAARVERFVFISSLAAVGPSPSLNTPVSDATVPQPIEAYGRSKLDAEGLVRRATDLAAVIVRPAAVYGPGDRDFLPLFRLARRGVAIHPANREHWLSIIHIRDLATAIANCTTAAEAPGRIYCLGSNEPVQWAELFRLVARCSGRVLTIDLEVPAPLVAAGAFVGDLAARLTGRSGLLTSEKVALSKARFWTCSSEGAARDLGFSAATPLQRGLCDTQQWYLEHGWL